MADAAARRWKEKDHGIWETRGPRKHFLYSKLMCWVALDRAIALADKHGLVYRYKTEDGIEGEEGSFLMCTFWLAHVLALAGLNIRAREVMEQTVLYANDVGLFSEEVHPATGELIGNFPQAFSHIGFVNAAWAIAQAEEGKHAAPRRSDGKDRRRPDRPVVSPLQTDVIDRSLSD